MVVVDHGLEGDLAAAVLFEVFGGDGLAEGYSAEDGAVLAIGSREVVGGLPDTPGLAGQLDPIGAHSDYANDDVVPLIGQIINRDDGP